MEKLLAIRAKTSRSVIADLLEVREGDHKKKDDQGDRSKRVQESDLLQINKYSDHQTRGYKPYKGHRATAEFITSCCHI
jgi:hypothetical protein